MKAVKAIIMIVLFAAVPVFAEDSQTLDAKTFRDVISGEWLGGGTYAIKSWGYLSLSGGVATPLNISGNAIPIFGIDYNIGKQLTDIVPMLKEAQYVILIGPVLNMLTFGGWAARDFTAGEYRAGWFTGIKIPID